MKYRLQCHMIMVRLLVALAFIGCGLEFCDGQAAIQWQDIPEPKHLRHRRHKHKDSKPMVKGVDYFSHHQSHGELFDWNSFKPANPTPKEQMTALGNGKPVSEMGLKQPVYVSMTTTSERIRYVAYSLIDVFKGSIVPTHVFLFVSNQGFMSDQGIQKEQLPKNLQDLASTQPLTIVFTKNIGPHRRLLPLLSKFWNTDCVIIALDDDKSSDYTQAAVEKLLGYYIHSGKSQIVALKARRIGLCPGLQVVSSFDGCTWPVVQNEKSELLSLPDGTGGVLYRPRFFHEVVFDPDLIELTKYNDDIAFRLASLVKGTHVFMGETDIPEPPECTIETESVSDSNTASNTNARIAAEKALGAIPSLSQAPSQPQSMSTSTSESSISTSDSTPSSSSSSSSSGDGFLFRRNLQAIDINSHQKLDLQTGLPVSALPTSTNPYRDYRTQELPGLYHKRDMEAMGIPTPKAPVVNPPPMQGGVTPLAGQMADGTLRTPGPLPEISKAIKPGDKGNWINNKMKNSYMWTDGLNYLEMNGYLNFTEMVINNALKERKECKLRKKTNKYSISDKDVITNCGFRAYSTMCDDIRQYHFETV